jgi:hypothetical protein
MLPASYRWVAGLPPGEQRLVLELLRLLDARIVEDQGGHLSAVFASELDAERDHP